MIFVGLPFVVRTVQPVLLDLDAHMEEAAATLGASRLTRCARVILPAVLPGGAHGFALAFARASASTARSSSSPGNMPMQTEIVPLLIVTKLEQYDYAGATAIALVMLLASFVLLFVINALQARMARGAHAVKDPRPLRWLLHRRSRSRFLGALRGAAGRHGVRRGVSQGARAPTSTRSATRRRWRRSG